MKGITVSLRWGPAEPRRGPSPRRTTAFRILDTNILLYSISRDPSEAAKRERSVTLLERDDVGLSIRVLGEFYVQATRATRSDALPHEIAAGLVEAWLRFPVQEIKRAVLIGALRSRRRMGFPIGTGTVPKGGPRHDTCVRR